MRQLPERASARCTRSPLLHWPNSRNLWCLSSRGSRQQAQRFQLRVGNKTMPSAEESKQEKLAALYAGYKQSFPGVPDIDPAGVQRLLKAQPDNVVLVDVRTAEEQAVSVLPGPTLTREQYEAQRAAHAGKTVVAYCTAGYRSGKYAAGLLKEGVDARNLAGSILAWTQAGLPLVSLEDRSQPSTRVHVYGPNWQGLEGPGYTTVTFEKPLLRGGLELIGSLARPFTALFNRGGSKPSS